MLQCAVLPANSISHVMPMKTNMSLCPSWLGSSSKTGPMPLRLSSSSLLQPVKPLFPFHSTAASLQICYCISNPMHPVTESTLVKMHSFIYTSNSCHCLERRGQKGRAGPSRTRCVTGVSAVGLCSLLVTLGTDGWNDKQADRKKENWLPFNLPRARSLTFWPWSDPVFLEGRKGNPS